MHSDVTTLEKWSGNEKAFQWSGKLAGGAFWGRGGIVQWGDFLYQSRIKDIKDI